VGVWLPAATDVLQIAGLTSGHKGTLQVLRQEGLWAATRHYFAGDPWALALAAPMVLVLAVEYLAILVGFAGSLRARMPADHWLILLMMLAFTLTVGAAGHPRYRAPIEPLLSLAVAGGLTWVCQWVRSARQPSVP
jgi:hypothetical protein